MKINLRRTVTAALLTGAIAAGTILGAVAPANAATKFEKINNYYTVAKHVDTVVYTPASHQSVKPSSKDLSGISKDYVLKLKHGKKVLLKKRVTGWVAGYSVNKVSYVKHYKNDSALVKQFKKAVKVSPKVAKAYVLKTLVEAKKAYLKASVRTEITNILVQQTVDGTYPLGKTKLDDDAYLVVSGNGTTDFVVKGYYPAVNYSYSFDSKTSKYTSGKIHS